jgi:hypothetical protein
VKWRDPTFMDDMRSSSDIQDADFTNQRVPRPPLSFTVAQGSGSNNLFKIRDGFTPRDRQTVSGYNIYFIPSSVSGPLLRKMMSKISTFNVGQFTCSIDSIGNSEILSAESPVHYGESGYFYCRAMNNTGTEGNPTSLAVAP